MSRRFTEPRHPLLRFLGYENGLVFWLPSLLVAAGLILFGIRQAPSERNRFNHARDLRLALGPVRVADDARDAAGAFEHGLQRGLGAQRELTLVDPERLRARLRALLGTGATVDPRGWMRGTRSLNVLYCLAAQLEAQPGGWSAQLDVWEVASEQRVHRLVADAADAESLGRALADSVGVVLFSPRRSATLAP